MKAFIKHKSIYLSFLESRSIPHRHGSEIYFYKNIINFTIIFKHSRKPTAWTLLRRIIRILVGWFYCKKCKLLFIN